MEKFKIKSIDEFDLDFVAKYNESEPEVAVEETDDSLNIDDLVPETQNETLAVQPTNENTQPFVSENVTPQKQTPSQVNSPAPPVQAEKKTEEKSKPQKGKQSGLAITGKIIATIMLVITVVSFVFGCFISVFLDNSNIDLGINLNTINSDTVIQSVENGQYTDVEIFSKGDLVISKKADPLDYYDIINKANNAETPEYIFITYSQNPDDENVYSDVYLLTDVLSATESNAVLKARNLTTGNTEAVEINTNDKCYHGMTSSYIPVLGGIIHFANSYSILVALLFVLLAAFWCLVLVLIDNQRYKTKKNKK